MRGAQAQAEGLTLLDAKNKTGYFGVYRHPGKPKPYRASVKRGGNDVDLGYFATAEEAALCVAQSPEGRAAAAERAAAAPPLTSEEARQQAQAEELTLLAAENTTGYSCVNLQPGRPKPYQAQVSRGGNRVNLGSFVTAEEAALCVARSPEGQAAAQKAAAAPPPTLPLTSEEARQRAQAERLTLRVAENSAGYFGVNHQPGRAKPYQAQVRRGGKDVYLGRFATAEEAALCIARSPEGQAAAKRAAAVVPQLSEEEGKVTVPPMPPGAFLKEEDMPSDAVVKDEGVVPPMPLDAFVKVEVVVKEEERSNRRPKRQRTK